MVKLDISITTSPGDLQERLPQGYASVLGEPGLSKMPKVQGVER